MADKSVNNESTAQGGGNYGDTLQKILDGVQ